MYIYIYISPMGFDEIFFLNGNLWKTLIIIGVRKPVVDEFRHFLEQKYHAFFFGVETSMGLYITDPGIQDESSQKITSFQNLRESMWMRCLTFVFNVAFFLLEKNKKTRLAWTFSSTSLHMSELYWHTGIVIKSCGKQEKKQHQWRGEGDEESLSSSKRTQFGLQTSVGITKWHESYTIS